MALELKNRVLKHTVTTYLGYSVMCVQYIIDFECGS